MITVKAMDSIGNTGIAKITITYVSANNPPKVITGPATSMTTNLVTLSGTVNAVGLPTTVWFQYGTSSGSYIDTSSTQSMDNISSDTLVSSRISGLLAGTTYYYRIAAQNNAGTAYGTEMMFNTKLPKGKIFGYVVYSTSAKPVESVRLRLKGTKAEKKSFKVTFSDANGFFKFNDLAEDTYDIFVTKADFKSTSQMVELKESEEKKIEIKLGRIKGEDEEIIKNK